MSGSYGPAESKRWRSNAPEWYEGKNYSKHLSRVMSHKGSDKCTLWLRGNGGAYRIIDKLEGVHLVDCRSITKAIIGYLYLKHENKAEARGVSYTNELGGVAVQAGLPNLQATTVLQLLNMRAGLRDISFESAERINSGAPMAHDPDNADFDVEFARRYNPPDTCTLFQWCQAHKPIEELKNEFHYDNVNYDILACLSEIIFGQSLKELLEQEGVADICFSFTRHGHLLGSTGLLATSTAICAITEAAMLDPRVRSSLEKCEIRFGYEDSDNAEMAGTGFAAYSCGWWIYQHDKERERLLCGVGSQGQRLVASSEYTLCRLHATGLQINEYEWMYRPENAESWSNEWEVGQQPPHKFFLD